MAKKQPVCGIYAIKNIVNGKLYIGQSRDIKSRWRWHISHLNIGDHSNEHLQHAWNKYGKESFEFIILDVCETYELNDMERKWEKAYSQETETYNIAQTGDGHSMSQEHRAKISKALKGKYVGVLNSAYGRKHTDEWKKRMSEMNSGKNCYWYGKHRSMETKEKLRLANLGKKASEESKAKKSKPVLQFDENWNFIKRWKSMREAQYELGIYNALISQACRIGCKAGGYFWRKAE